ncbi:MAG: T9SS type A sorting domain-containing protein [Candidatus Eisenbacteria bacterium]|nr:T9SS type A sorting domain-containing protein [Candidatus Eisenbacteria bacterium]
MRHFIIRAAVLAMLIGGTTLAYAFSTGPPLTRTGAEILAGKPAEPNCTVCHTPEPVNSNPNGSCKIVGAPALYIPGNAYHFEVQLNYNWSATGISPYPVKWGFEITAIQASNGDSAGTWILGAPPDSFQIRRYATSSLSTYKRRIYLEHTIYDYHWGENQDGLSGPIAFHVTWVAPRGDSGKVIFACAGNAANGDSVSIGSGDHIYTTAESTYANILLDVRPPVTQKFVTAFEIPYPNPMTRCLNLQFQIGRAGPVDLSVFDLQGRRVRTLVHERLEPSEYGNFWDGHNDSGVQMKNGVYFIRLSAPGLTKPLSHRVTLAR